MWMQWGHGFMPIEGGIVLLLDPWANDKTIPRVAMYQYGGFRDANGACFTPPVGTWCLQPVLPPLPDF